MLSFYKRIIVSNTHPLVVERSNLIFLYKNLMLKKDSLQINLLMKNKYFLKFAQFFTNNLF